MLSVQFFVADMVSMFLKKSRVNFFKVKNNSQCINQKRGLLTYRADPHLFRSQVS